jgi:hypothetical protein
MSWAAIDRACGAMAGSIPRSNRYEASVLSPSARRVSRTWRGVKYATSRKRSVVDAVTSLSSPPITPATATARSASAITVMRGSSVRDTPSSVTSTSPGCARRTTTVCPASRLRSKACIGCP